MSAWLKNTIFFILFSHLFTFLWLRFCFNFKVYPLLACNMAGNDKLAPFVVGKSKHPRPAGALWRQPVRPARMTSNFFGTGCHTSKSGCRLDCSSWTAARPQVDQHKSCFCCRTQLQSFSYSTSPSYRASKPSNADSSWISFSNVWNSTSRSCDCLGSRPVTGSSSCFKKCGFKTIDRFRCWFPRHSGWKTSGGWDAGDCGSSGSRVCVHRWRSWVQEGNYLADRGYSSHGVRQCPSKHTGSILRP